MDKIIVKSKIEFDESDMYKSVTTLDYPILNDENELVTHLEMMNDRRIITSLRMAGLSDFIFDADEKFLTDTRNWDLKAKMITGEPLLSASILFVKDIEQQLLYIAVLLFEGADPNETDPKGKTALMYACEYGYEKTVKALLNQDSVNLYYQDPSGNTALMCAAANGYLNIIKLYYKTLRKFDKRSVVWFLEMENNEGFNAGTLALENNYFQCVTLLEEIRMKCLKEMSKTSKNMKNKYTSFSVRFRDTSTKYEPQVGSYESLYSDKNVPRRRGTMESNNVYPKDTVKPRKFQSETDLGTKSNKEKQRTKVIGSTETNNNQLPSTHISFSIGVNIHNRQQSDNSVDNNGMNLMRSKKERIKELSNAETLAIVSPEETFITYEILPEVQQQKVDKVRRNFFKQRQMSFNEPVFNQPGFEIQQQVIKDSGGKLSGTLPPIRSTNSLLSLAEKNELIENFNKVMKLSERAEDIKL